MRKNGKLHGKEVRDKFFSLCIQGELIKASIIEQSCSTNVEDSCIQHFHEEPS
jgi:hypothetical protein